MSRIPILDLQPEIEAQRDELREAFERVLSSGHFIMGPEVEAFEEEVASYLEVDHAIAVNSGTDALLIALRALGIGPGDEVITSSFTFFATVESIELTGAKPVFADIRESTLNLDPGRVAERLGPRTRAIVPVHLFGHAAEMDAIGELAAEHDLVVVEDAAQAFGARYRERPVGTLADAAAFSFFPSKNLGGFGDGGMITTDDPELAASARMLRVHGAKRKYHNEVLGYNSRLDALQAALLRVKLPHIDESNQLRRDAAAVYDELLAEVDGASPIGRARDVEPIFHQYTIRVAGGRRDELHEALGERGISTMVYYPIPVHRLPLYADRTEDLPETERAAAEVLSLPIWPSISHETQEKVVTALRDVLG